MDARCSLASKSSAVDEIAAAKAQNESLRERIAARRQQRQNLIAGVTAKSSSLSSRSAAKVTALLTGKPLAADSTEQHGNTPILASSTVVNDPSLIHISDSGAAVSNVCSVASVLKPISSSSSFDQSTHHPQSLSSPLLDDSASVSDTCVFTPSISVECTVDTETLKTSSPGDVSKRIENHPHALRATKAPRLEDILSPTSNELESLLSAETAKEREVKRFNDEIMELLNTPSIMEKVLNEKFRSQGGSQVQLFCLHGTRGDCSSSHDKQTCTKLHFRKIIRAHTDESLGDCSFLNTCFHVDTCKYVHYEIDPADLTTDEAVAAAGAYNRGQLRPDVLGNLRPSAKFSDDQASVGNSIVLKTPSINVSGDVPLYPPQWINCDIRQLDMSVLGKFSVIMADPPWDIHMELPYGTMSDDEMRRMDVPGLQDDGYIFLWVTGRAMELGRECLKLWGYERVDELIWVKTNQLQRLIRTGRTGHWLNHGKEHCLVGVKGSPKCMNRGLDCDVIVSEVRETSRKPDEIYGIIERLSPGTRKIELFGRPHNVQSNWITLGNQLDGTYLVDPAVVERYRARYPNGTESKSAES